MTKTQIEQIEKLGNDSKYEEQAKYFLECCNVHMEYVEAVPQNAPEWATDGKHGIKYSISLAKIKEGHTLGRRDTIHNQPHSFSEIIEFPFWGSIADKEKANHSKPVKVTAYDVLAGLDAMYDDTFEDWCFNYGYNDDSRKVYKIYQRCVELDAKLKKVFTSDEIDALQYIV